MNIEAIKNHFVKNRAEIAVAYNEAIAHRELVAEINAMIKGIAEEVLKENDFKIADNFISAVENNEIKDYDLIYFLADSDAYNNAFYEKVKDNKKYYDFFEMELGSYDPRMGFYEASWGFEYDKKLVDLVRSYKIDPNKSYDKGIIDKEIEIIGELLSIM